MKAVKAWIFYDWFSIEAHNEQICCVDQVNFTRQSLRYRGWNHKIGSEVWLINCDSYKLENFLVETRTNTESTYIRPLLTANKELKFQTDKISYFMLSSLFVADMPCRLYGVQLWMSIYISFLYEIRILEISSACTGKGKRKICSCFCRWYSLLVGCCVDTQSRKWAGEWIIKISEQDQRRIMNGDDDWRPFIVFKR